MSAESKSYEQPSSSDESGWLELISEQKSSGESTREFYIKRNITPNSLGWQPVNIGHWDGLSAPDRTKDWKTLNRASCASSSGLELTPKLPQISTCYGLSNFKIS